MKRYAANDAKQNFGSLLDDAQRQPVVIERHGRPKAVVMSYEDYKIQQEQKLNALKLDVQAGLDQLARGKVKDFDLDRVRKLGRTRLKPQKAG